MVDRIADIRQQLQARLDVVLVNVPAFDAASGHLPLRTLDLRLAELTALFTMRTFGLQLGDIQFAANHDAALASGTKDFCLIQKIGHIFHGPADNVAGALLGEMDMCPFLTGHIMERGGYYYLHDQCVLVNRRAWETLGRQAFGTPTEGPRRAAVPKRSALNVHDDYTPVLLEPTGEERDWQGAFGYGWHAISESLRRGIRVLNWSDAARRWKRNCYAYYGDPSEWQRALADVTITTPTVDDGLRGIAAFLEETSSSAAASIQVFGDDLATDIPHLRVRNGIDCVVASARGFGVNRILESIGFNDQTKVVFTDVRPESLAFKRLMIERWDGDDLPTFLQEIGIQIVADFPAATLDPANATPAYLNQTFRQAWGLAFPNQTAWREHWDRFRSLRHEFVVVDPVADPVSFCALLRSQHGAIRVLSLGDAFNAFAAVARFDGARRRKAYDMVVATLKADAKLHLVVGSPPLVRIRGV